MTESVLKEKSRLENRPKACARNGRCADIAIRFLFAASICVIASEREAHAYIDPGSGALMWQAIMAGLLGSVFYFRSFWKRIWLRNKKAEESLPQRDEK